jgi:hypothetical protein
MEKEEDNKIKTEMNRVKKFCKENKLVIVLIILLVLILLPNLNITGTKAILKGGMEGEYQFNKFELFLLWLIGKKIYETLKKNGTSAPMAVLITFVKVVIVRPIYGITIIFASILAISGSFIFPFILFGILLYYLVRKGLTNKKLKL